MYAVGLLLLLVLDAQIAAASVELFVVDVLLL